MAYLEVTNLIANPPKGGVPAPRETDEGYPHRAGQRYLDGRAHDRLRLRGVHLERSARPPPAPLDHGAVGRPHRADRHLARLPRAGDSRADISRIDAVLYTHGHADHILGLDDVRPLSFPRVTGGGKIPLYATENTARSCAMSSATSSMATTSTEDWRRSRSATSMARSNYSAQPLRRWW